MEFIKHRIGYNRPFIEGFLSANGIEFFDQQQLSEFKKKVVEGDYDARYLEWKKKHPIISFFNRYVIEIVSSCVVMMVSSLFLFLVFKLEIAFVAGWLLFFLCISLCSLLFFPRNVKKIEWSKVPLDKNFLSEYKGEMKKFFGCIQLRHQDPSLRFDVLYHPSSPVRFLFVHHVDDGDSAPEYCIDSWERPEEVSEKVS